MLPTSPKHSLVWRSDKTWTSYQPKGFRTWLITWYKNHVFNPGFSSFQCQISSTLKWNTHWNGILCFIGASEPDFFSHPWGPWGPLGSVGSLGSLGVPGVPGVLGCFHLPQHVPPKSFVLHQLHPQLSSLQGFHLWESWDHRTSKHFWAIDGYGTHMQLILTYVYNIYIHILIMKL